MDGLGEKMKSLGFQLGLIKLGLILWNYIRYCKWRIRKSTEFRNVQNSLKYNTTHVVFITHNEYVKIRCGQK